MHDWQWQINSCTIKWLKLNEYSLNIAIICWWIETSKKHRYVNTWQIDKHEQLNKNSNIAACLKPAGKWSNKWILSCGVLAAETFNLILSALKHTWRQIEFDGMFQTRNGKIVPTYKTEASEKRNESTKSDLTFKKGKKGVSLWQLIKQKNHAWHIFIRYRKQQRHKCHMLG